MIAGADFIEVDNENDTVTVLMREDHVTTKAYLPGFKAIELRDKLTEHINAALAWRPPSLIEYTGAGDLK